MSAIGLIAGLWALVSWLGHIGSAAMALAQPAFAARRARSAEKPAVSILIPVHHDEPYLESCLESAFTLDWPEVEVVIAAKDASPLVIETARRVMARHPHVPAAIVVGDDDFAMSPKVDNLAAAVRAARHPLLLQQDANIRLDAGMLADLAAEMTDGVGLIVAVPIGIAADGFAAKVERSFLNEYHVRWLLAGSALGQGYGIGKLMLVRRSAFDRAGGLNAIAHTVAEDHALTLALERVGARTLIAGRVATQIVGRRDPKTVWERQLRWMVLRRIENRWAFVGEFAFNGVVAALMTALAVAIAGGPAATAAAASLAAWVAVELAFLAAKGWPWSKTTPLAILLREMMVPFLWARALTTREVVWRGRRMPVRSAG